MKAHDPLPEELRDISNALLDLLIPPSLDGKKPGASEIDFPSQSDNAGLISAYIEMLTVVADEAREGQGLGFEQLPKDIQQDIYRRYCKSSPRIASQFQSALLQAYYQNQRVLIGMGAQPRPPFPLGYEVEDGDLSLLEQVYERGEIYRRASLES